VEEEYEVRIFEGNHGQGRGVGREAGVDEGEAKVVEDHLKVLGHLQYLVSAAIKKKKKKNAKHRTIQEIKFNEMTVS
jgi:hypothetical protein